MTPWLVALALGSAPAAVSAPPLAIVGARVERGDGTFLATGTVIVGAYGHQPSRAGAAYVIEWDGDRWSLTLLQPNICLFPCRLGAQAMLVALDLPLDTQSADVVHLDLEQLFNRLPDFGLGGIKRDLEHILIVQVSYHSGFF